MKQVLLLTGFNINQRRRRKSRIGATHRISKEESIKWFQSKVGTACVVCFLSQLSCLTLDAISFAFVHVCVRVCANADLLTSYNLGIRSVLSGQIICTGISKTMILW